MYERLTSEVVVLIRHAELSSEKDWDKQQHVRVPQLSPNGPCLGLEVGLLHVWDLGAIASVDLLWLRKQKCKGRTQR